MLLTEPAAIRPDFLYPIESAKQILGWKATAMRSARRAGLRVRYVSGRGYVRGQDIIDYIESHGKDQK